MATPSRKNAKTLYLPPDVQAFIAEGEGSASAVVTRTLRRYAQMILRSMPTNLSVAELDFIRAVLRDYRADTPDHLRGIAAMVKAWQPAPGDSRPPGVDPSALAFRMETMPLAQLIALMEFVERNRSTSQR